MDFLSAFSGLERIAIIGGAMVVGYWGFRLLATDRTPALVFMGISCAVLFGALLTGGTHIKNIGESYQLANAAPPSVTAFKVAEQPASPQQQTGEDQDPITAASAPVIEPEAESAIELATELPLQAATETPKQTAASESSEPTLEEVAPTLAPDTSGLLSSQELGGRIVAVKSEAVTLEWSPRDG
ncbi:MAG: hypothetical protein VB949_09240 [Pseudomonadales bacterium]